MKVRVEQTTTWFVEATSLLEVENFLTFYNVDDLGPEDSVEETITEAGADTCTAVNIPALIAEMTEEPA